ncbi:MAG: HEAT repeat domain-containing protein, partial [Planctomycetota bacterium]
MSQSLFPWMDQFAHAFSQATDARRMAMAARLWACGQESYWQDEGYAQHPQRDAWLITLADAAGAAVVAAHTQDAPAMAEAFYHAQDVFLLQQALAAAGVWVTGEADIAVRACIDAAEDAVLDAQAVDLIEAWPWRRLIPESLLLAVIAEPISLQDMLLVTSGDLVRGSESSSPASSNNKGGGAEAAGSQCAEQPQEPTAKNCNQWIAAIRELEGEDLRGHFKQAWQWTAFDRPIFQLTWLLQDPRRTVEDRIYALHALARYAHPLGWHIIAHHCQRTQQRDAEIRLQACFAMCWTGRLALDILPQVLADRGEDRPVRMAAARALLMLCNNDEAQKLVRTVGDTDREDRRLLAVAAVARGDGDTLARLSLDGFGAPELPRWGLTALGQQQPPTGDALVQALLTPSHRGTVTVLALPIWAVQFPQELAHAALQAAQHFSDHQSEKYLPPGLLLRAAACLHEYGIPVWEALRQHHVLPGRCHIGMGLAGGDGAQSLDSHLRHPNGASAIMSAIGSNSRSFAERDHALLLLVLHSRLYPHVQPDKKKLVKALRRAIHDGRPAMAQDKRAEAMVHRAVWAIGTLRIHGCEPLILESRTEYHWEPWALSQLQSPESADILKELAENTSQIEGQLVWALTDRRVDVGDRVLVPGLARNPGFWRYAIFTNNTEQKERLDHAPADAALAYRIFLQDDGREPASMTTLHRAWRHFEGVDRLDLAIDLIPEMYEHNPDDAWERVVRLGESLDAQAYPELTHRLENALQRARDPALRTMLEGLRGVIGMPPIALPDILREILRQEEEAHLSYAGRQLHADSGKVRGSGVVELAKTFEVACRHHVASRLAEPLSLLARSRYDAAALRRRLREGLADAGMRDIEPHCYEGRVEEVLRATVD